MEGVDRLTMTHNLVTLLFCSNEDISQILLFRIKWWEARCIFFSVVIAFELSAICSLRSFYGLAKQDGTWFFCIVDFRLVNLTSEDFFVRVTSSAKAFFEVVDVLIERFSWGVSSQKLSLRASPFMRPFLTPWGSQKEKCVYWKVSVGLKWVRMSRIPWLWNLSPL